MYIWETKSKCPKYEVPRWRRPKMFSGLAIGWPSIRSRPNRHLYWNPWSWTHRPPATGKRATVTQAKAEGTLATSATLPQPPIPDDFPTYNKQRLLHKMTTALFLPRLLFADASDISLLFYTYSTPQFSSGGPPWTAFQFSYSWQLSAPNAYPTHHTSISTPTPDGPTTTNVAQQKIQKRGGNEQCWLHQGFFLIFTKFEPNRNLYKNDLSYITINYKYYIPEGQKK